MTDKKQKDKSKKAPRPGISVHSREARRQANLIAERLRLSVSDVIRMAIADLFMKITNFKD